MSSQPAVPGAWKAFWQNVVRFQADKVTPWLALRNSIGVTVPLALGVALGSIPAGLAICTGALNVAFSDSHDPYIVRARRMLAASALVGAAVFAGALCGQSNAFAVTIAGGWAFAAGLLVALSTAAADLGTLSLIVLVVYGAVPQTPERAAIAGGLAFLGGLFQTALALLLWPLRRYVPERRALADLYNELARVAPSPISSAEAPPASAQSTQAQTVLASLHRDHSIQGERYRLLLSQAERMRLSLLALERLRARIGHELPGGPEGQILDRYFAASTQILSAIGDALKTDQTVKGVAEWLRDVQSTAEHLRDSGLEHPAPLAALLSDARFQMDALAGQLRSAIDLEASASPAGLTAFQQREVSKPWRLRLSGTLATLRANLSLNSAACRHAVRLAVCIALADGVGRGLELRRSYWLPMTVAIVLKPDFTATFSRGVLRLVGTFVGLVLATALFHVLAATPAVETALIGISMFVLRCWGPANYGVVVTSVTALVVFLIAMTGVAPSEVIAARGLNTAAGGVIALAAYWLWPTWERTQVPEFLARMLDAYRDHFRALRESYQNPDKPSASALDRTRLAARLARSNLEASIDRLFAEPGTSPANVRALSGILASSHRLVHALMALEAGLVSSHPVPPRAAFHPYANDVELTLYYLSAALRGSPLRRAELPDLREAHHALVSSGDALTERYALVNVETDRITNSLNTLSEELLAWLGSSEKAA